jgi:homoserine acetyltransferase
MAASPTYDGTGVQHYKIPDFAFSSGTTLHDVAVAYRSINPSSTHGTVLIPTCYHGLINTTLTFTNAPFLALEKYHVVVVAMLGNGESASPSNKKFFPEVGELRYEDVVRSQHALLTEGLGVKELEAVVGFSMGGQQAYHWGVMYPSFVKRVVSICSSARTSLHNYTFLEGPIGGLTASIDYIAWKAMKAKVAAGEPVGANLKDVVPKKGLAAFTRGYAAWLTSTTWFRERLFTKLDGSPQSIEQWLQNSEQGKTGWDADDLLITARMWQMGDIATVVPGQSEKLQSTLGGKIPDDAAYEKALQSIQAKVLLMPCRSDQYFPPEDSEIEMKYLKQGTLAVIESCWGHTAGGGLNPDDTKFMNDQIAKFMME